MEVSSVVTNIGGVEPLTEAKTNPVFHSLYILWDKIVFSTACVKKETQPMTIITTN